jgi:hypothetical protein
MALSRFAGMWSYANATPIVDVPEADEAVEVLTWQHATALGAEADSTAGTIRIEAPGFYLGYFFASFIGTTGITYFFEFRANGIVGAGFRCTADGVTGAAVNVAMMGGANFDEGDVITVVVYADEDGENITVVDGQFGVISI